MQKGRQRRYGCQNCSGRAPIRFSLPLHVPTAPQGQSAGPSGGPTAQLPLEEGPCPSCTALLDNWEGAVPHVEGLGANIAAVAKAPIERVAAFAAHRGWRNLKLLSAANNSYKRDYHGEDDEGQQMPILTVFHKGRDGVIRLSWASELLFVPAEPKQDPRHVGTVEPMWTLLDLTPGGRPDANEQLEYESTRTQAQANRQA